MNLTEVSSTQRFKEVTINENFESIDYSSVYGKRLPVTEGLTWGYWGGRWGGFSVAAGTLTLTNAADNYVVVLRSTGAISVSTASTNWDNTQLYARVYKITVAGSVVTAVEDHRAGPGGVHGPSATTVSGPSSSTDNAISRFDGTTGKLLQNSVVTISDTGAIAGAISLSISQGTITDPANAFTVASTWNDAADTFVGASIDITNTASAAGSLIQRWRADGVGVIGITVAGQLLVSTNTVISTNGPLTPAFQVSGTSAATATAAFTRWAAGSGAAFFVGGKSRGGATVGLHGAVSSAEDLFTILAEGSDGAGFFRAVRFDFATDGTVSTGVVPGKWTASTANSAGVMTQAFQIDSSQFLYHYGNFVSTTAYSRVAFKYATATLASVSGASVTATNVIPAGAKVVGVNTKVTVALGTGGGTTGYQVGDGTDADRWGTVTGTSTNTDTDGTNATADPEGTWSAAARNVVITANGGNFNGTGSIRVDVFYTLTEAD